MRKVGIISLGCPRNLVDSEIMLGSLKECGFEIGDVKDGVDVCVINTCAFIESARAESIDAILEASQAKKEGRIRYLVVAGCLSQAYKKKLAEELPEADLILGTSDFPRISELVKTLARPLHRVEVSSGLKYLYDERSPRLLTTPPHYAYVKISEGCSNLCSYCIIKDLRGAFRSRSIESVVAEVKRLSAGLTLKEIDLIGQDTTLFGQDLYKRKAFPGLLRKLCALKDSVRWIRILYTHPAHYTGELISTIRDEEKICKYLDLPIQHISDSVLKRMGRNTTRKDIAELIGSLRKNIPGLILRTSIIVGFPGETDGDFKELLKFINDTKFEALGAFLYSKEDGTPAARFDGEVPEDVKKERFDALMKEQKIIASLINKDFLGRTVEVMVDETIEGERDKYLGRTQGQAPEVDGTVYVSGKDLKAGEFYDVKITDTLEYDLVGERV